MKFIPLLLLCYFLSRCAEEAVAEQSGGEASSVADIIRLPVAATAGGPVDTLHVARLAPAADTYDFGSVAAGQRISHDFTFTNDGRVPLLITDARSTCGCTVADFPKGPVAPGAGGRIRVIFDTTGKRGRQRKPVTLTANTHPSTTTLYLAGEVTEN